VLVYLPSAECTASDRPLLPLVRPERLRRRLARV